MANIGTHAIDTTDLYLSASSYKSSKKWKLGVDSIHKIVVLWKHSAVSKDTPPRQLFYSIDWHSRTNPTKDSNIGYANISKMLFGKQRGKWNRAIIYTTLSNEPVGIILPHRKNIIPFEIYTSWIKMHYPGLKLKNTGIKLSAWVGLHEESKLVHSIENLFCHECPKLYHDGLDRDIGTVSYANAIVFFQHQIPYYLHAFQQKHKVKLWYHTVIIQDEKATWKKVLTMKPYNKAQTQLIITEIREDILQSLKEDKGGDFIIHSQCKIL